MIFGEGDSACFSSSGHDATKDGKVRFKQLCVCGCFSLHGSQRFLLLGEDVLHREAHAKGFSVLVTGTRLRLLLVTDYESVIILLETYTPEHRAVRTIIRLQHVHERLVRRRNVEVITFLGAGILQRGTQIPTCVQPGQGQTLFSEMHEQRILAHCRFE